MIDRVNLLSEKGDDEVFREAFVPDALIEYGVYRGEFPDAGRGPGDRRCRTGEWEKAMGE